MSEYKFNSNERYAVYKVFGGICQWCGEPVEFKNSHIDHLIPEVLLKKTEELNKVLDSYGLDESFDLNDFENWIPLHPNCNTRKNAAVYTNLPAIRTILDRCATYKEQARKIKIKLDREPKKSEILTQIRVALEKEVINKEELHEFILDYNLEDITNESDIEIQRLISLGILNVFDPDKWKVSKILNDDEAFVTNGTKGGIVPRKSPPHISWLCPSCLNFGPWNGNKCINCGAMTYPD